MRELRFCSLLGPALLAAALCLLPGCGGGGSGTTAPAPQQDILLALQATPGVSDVTEVTSTLAGTRFFRFHLTQAVDHTAVGGPTFPQFVTLLYRSRTAPVVLATTGYAISQNPGQGEPTRILGANQITMEHRFFNTSTPAPADWTKLSIQQSAADEHQVVTALKPLFSGKWLNTGGSKGGMTALFHRRFYPNDVDVTLAYVAPINLANGDTRYPPFIDARGDTATRLAIEAWQQAIFSKRAEVLALLQADAMAQGQTFNALGADKTLEFAVLESPFVLWQYGNAALAAQVPAAGANAQQLYAYLDQVNSGVVGTWADSTLSYYQAYYQQCANQLGYPANKESHLTGLSYPGQDVPAIYPPPGASKAYDGGVAMQDIQTWMDTAARKVILVYGENDPWTAGALTVTAAAQARDVHKYIAPLGNHGSKLASLTSADANAAYALLAQWMGAPVTPAAPPQTPAARQVEDLMDTFVVRRQIR
ncbi:MAG TPA: S28 family serine protease [Holophagaceae bacterium]|nr:S28 family serine protease [Holophagaceae bacterium]